MKKRSFQPESLMTSFGYRPEWSEGAIKCPVFQTSTFVFSTAEEGKRYFELAYGLCEQAGEEEPGLIYSRLNNPDLEILEKRLKLWDGAEDCAVFASGMSAISTALLEFLQPGEVLLYSQPLYGGTAHFISEFLPKYGIETMGFTAGDKAADIYKRLQREGKEKRVGMIFVETPANPTCALINIEAISGLARKLSSQERRAIVAVDNTFMGPLWQHPLKLGADLVIYSATKYIGGHSDLLAGACLGSADLIKRIKTLRTFLGNMASPWTSWLLMRSLETLKARMELQCRNAVKVARFLQNHPLIKKICYLGLLRPEDGEQYKIYQTHFKAPGAMLAFEIEGGEKEAFTFLNNLKLVKLAVSLGSTESLAQHPASMTHAGVPKEEKRAVGITDNLVRLSVGVEEAQDLIWDLKQALQAVADLKAKSAEQTEVLMYG